MTKVARGPSDWKPLDPVGDAGHPAAMADSERSRADARLETALSGADQQDPRGAYRPVLRYLRDRDDAAFQRVLRYFENTLVPAVAGEADPLAEWLEYGRVLAEELGSGRTLELDSTGRARATQSPEDARGMVVFVPDLPAAPVLLLREPKEASAAQMATRELLVEGRQTASRYEG